MAVSIPWYVTLGIILVAYGLVVYAVRKKKFLADRGVSSYGPFIMWRTEGGKRLIDRLAKPVRFWKAYAFLGKLICLGVGVFIMALLIWEATIVSRIPDDQVPTPEMMLGIPGINPVIPIVFGIIGLVVGIIVHEFAHGILTRVGRMNIKSLGLFLFIVPMGAFVEPDEQQIATADRKRRSDVYAAGPSTNIILAIFCAILFCTGFMASAQPVSDNPVVVSVGKDSPANLAGIGYGMQLDYIGGVPVTTLDEFNSLMFEPGSQVTVSYHFKGEAQSTNAVAGLTLIEVQSGLAASSIGLKPGMILAMLNGTVIHNQQELTSTLELTHPGQTVPIRALYYDEGTASYHVYSADSITLSSRNAYLEDVDPGAVNGSTPDRGFMGINSAYMGILVTTPESIIARLAHPLAGVDDMFSFFGASLLFIALPFQGFAPIESPMADLFVPGGIFAWMPAEVFWFLANSFYWIFWINLMLGMTNVLPAVPLDGGYLFRDAMDSLVSRFKKNATEKERAYYVSTITYLLAIFVFFLIMWQLIGPRLL